MPVKIKITLLFTAIAAVVLCLVCGTTYYVSAVNRVNSIKTRLTNRAITTARLLSQSETFNQEVIARIDALTASALRNKTVQAYDNNNNSIYSFNDSDFDTIPVQQFILDQARSSGSSYFRSGKQDAVAYYFSEGNNRIVILSAAYDELGENSLHQLLYILIASSIGGVIVSLISGFFFSERLMSPIKNIADQVNEISAQNLTARVPAGKSRDEWHYLSETLNNLLNRLQDSFESQRRFISNASHELSTPLTSISSQLEVYLQKDRDIEEYKAVMHSLSQDVKHLSDLTKTLLEFAKASGSPAGIELNQFRIDEVLLRLPAEVAKINNTYSVVLNFNELAEDENALLIFGNEELLFTAVKNIVVNACKYSADHQATVSLYTYKGYIKVIIQDNGLGIPIEDLKKIFEPFYRSDSLKKTEGFGLGLSLAQRIVKLHKGTIDVKSGDDGSVFTIVLSSAGEVKI
jgi:two-component system, OmpR family, sensor histidine kinase ArlS